MLKGGSHELVISAGGVAEEAKKVHDLVASAPDVPGWKIIAFRQRSSPDSTLRWEGVDSPGDKVRVQTVTSQGRIHVRLYLAVPENTTKEALGQLAFLHLDHTLGELDVMRKIGQVKYSWLPLGVEDQYTNLPPEADQWRLITLAELRAMVDSLNDESAPAASVSTGEGPGF